MSLLGRIAVIWSLPAEVAALRERVIELEGWKRPKARRLSRAARHRKWLKGLREVPTTQEEREEWESGMA